MVEFLKLGILFFTGAVAGFINVNAGGGSSLTLPVMIFLGLDSSVANGTNRIGILMQTFSSVSSFRKQQYHDFKISFTLACFALPGAIAGALISVQLSDSSFQKILGIIMIGIVISMIFSSQKKERSSTDSKQNWWLYPAMVGVGFYGGFIQVGVGFLLMASLYYLLKVSLIRVNMHKVFIVFIYTIPALFVFILTKNVHWVFGIVLALGMALGGWWGAKIAVKGGEKVIRMVLIGAIVIMALKLLGIF
ncbi:MAG: sulfite exporter TauE/SafE family protein [bacterium]